jgi:hypothetical protein
VSLRARNLLRIFSSRLTSKPEWTLRCDPATTGSSMEQILHSGESFLLTLFGVIQHTTARSRLTTCRYKARAIKEPLRAPTGSFLLAIALRCSACCS